MLLANNEEISEAGGLDTITGEPVKSMAKLKSEIALKQKYKITLRGKVILSVICRSNFASGFQTNQSIGERTMKRMLSNLQMS